jgi:hypothetical protein
MKRLLIAGALVAATALSACATPTPYQPATFTSAGPRNGFYEQPIEQNRWRVGFAGNTVTSRQQVEDSLLLRAAELTLQQGYDSFTTVNRATERDVRYSASPALGSSFGYGLGYPYSRFGYGFGYSRFGYPYWSPAWSLYGPYGRRAFHGFGYDPFWNDVDIRQIDRYEATAEIVMERGANRNDPRSFDARQVVQNLGARVPRPMAPAPGPYRY